MFIMFASIHLSIVVLFLEVSILEFSVYDILTLLDLLLWQISN